MRAHVFGLVRAHACSNWADIFLFLSLCPEMPPLIRFLVSLRRRKPGNNKGNNKGFLSLPKVELGLRLGWPIKRKNWIWWQKTLLIKIEFSKWFIRCTRQILTLFKYDIPHVNSFVYFLVLIKCWLYERMTCNGHWPSSMFVLRLPLLLQP